MVDKIAEYRQEIANIDNQLIELFNERFTYSQLIGKEKKLYALPVMNLDLENKIMERLTEKEKYSGTVEAIWPNIFNFSRTLQ